MKRIISALSLISILFLVSCSDFEQESSPIVPEFQKTSTNYEITSGTYEYLQCFDLIPVQSIQSSTTLGSIEIVISPKIFPKYFMHMFVMLEYKDSILPLRNSMIFVGKPNSNIIRIDGVNESSLKSVKVYAYIPKVDGKGISQPYNYLTSFQELTVTEWNVSNNEILIFTQDWSSSLGDTFIELTIAHPGSQNHVLTYIAKPMEGKLILPKFLKERITQVKMYGLFNYLEYE